MIRQVVGSEVSNLAPFVENWIRVVNNYRPKPTSASRDASHILADGEVMKCYHKKKKYVAEAGIKPA